MSDSAVSRFGRRDFVLFAVFLALSVFALTLPRDRQEKLASWIRGTLLAPFLEVQSRWVVERDLRSAVTRLRKERDSLAGLVVSLEDVVQENDRLRRLAGLAGRARPAFVPANLVPSGRGGGERQTFLLDVGRRSGVEPPAPVVTPGGLVGVVRSVGFDHAAGDFWTHPDFRASAMAEDGKAFGIVEPAPGAYAKPPTFLLTGVPYQVELARGTLIVTSGLGGVFPRGIPIGRVHELARTEEGWAKTYRLDPAVHPGAAVEVLVLMRGAADLDPGALWSSDTTVRADTARR